MNREVRGELNNIYDLHQKFELTKRFKTVRTMPEREFRAGVSELTWSERYFTILLLHTHMKVLQPSPRLIRLIYICIAHSKIAVLKAHLTQFFLRIDSISLQLLVACLQPSKSIVQKYFTGRSIVQHTTLTGSQGMRHVQEVCISSILLLVGRPTYATVSKRCDVQQVDPLYTLLELVANEH